MDIDDDSGVSPPTPRRFRLEYQISNSNATKDEIREIVFLATQKRFKTIACLPPFLSSVKEFRSKYYELEIAAIIDYPHGVNSTKTKMFLAMDCIRQGVNYLDVVANINHIHNDKLHLLVEEIRLFVALGYERNVEVRYILDPHELDLTNIVDIAKLFKANGITTLILESGLVPDDLTDNLLLQNQIDKKTKLNVILNTASWRMHHIEAMQKSEIYGARFRYLSAVKEF
jgi:deoxyribose-phosphate aldolase